MYIIYHILYIIFDLLYIIFYILYIIYYILFILYYILYIIYYILCILYCMILCYSIFYYTHIMYIYIYIFTRSKHGFRSVGFTSVIVTKPSFHKFSYIWFFKHILACFFQIMFLLFVLKTWNHDWHLFFSTFAIIWKHLFFSIWSFDHMTFEQMAVAHKVWSTWQASMHSPQWHKVRKDTHHKHLNHVKHTLQADP